MQFCTIDTGIVQKNVLQRLFIIFIIKRPINFCQQRDITPRSLQFLHSTMAAMDNFARERVSLKYHATFTLEWQLCRQQKFLAGKTKLRTCKYSKINLSHFLTVKLTLLCITEAKYKLVHCTALYDVIYINVSVTMVSMVYLKQKWF